MSASAAKTLRAAPRARIVAPAGAASHRPRPIARGVGHKHDFRSLADFRVGADELDPRRDR